MGKCIECGYEEDACLEDFCCLDCYNKKAEELEDAEQKVETLKDALEDIQWTIREILIGL